MITGDARTTQLEPESVQTIICSPPYWGLRDYKHKQAIGIERSEEEFLENLFSVFDSLKPTLKKDGCLFVEIGDAATGNTYSGILERFVLGMISRGWLLRERLIVSREQSASNRTSLITSPRISSLTDILKPVCSRINSLRVSRETFSSSGRFIRLERSG